MSGAPHRSPFPRGAADFPHTLAEEISEPLVSKPRTANSRRSRRIDVGIAGPYRKELSAVWIEMVATEALQSALPDGEPGQVSVLVAGDETLRDLCLLYTSPSPRD